MAFFVLSFLACQDAKEETKSIADFSYFRNVGKQIPTQTGYRWMDVYRAKLNLAGREKPSGYALSKENLAALFGSVETPIGFVFQHGADDTGTHHFLIIPIDESLQIWSQGKSIVDANTDAVISYEEALHWANNYEAANPTQIQYHFFGKHVFDEMAAISFFEYIQIEPAINDENQKPQVLLIVNDLSIETSSGGRTEIADAMIYDASLPCPDTCPLLEF